MTTPTDLFILIWKDRHADTTAHAYRERDHAIADAKHIARKFAALNDCEPEEMDLWEFYASYSAEGDCVYVTKGELRERPLGDKLTEGV